MSLHLIYADARRAGLERFQRSDPAKLAAHYQIPETWAIEWKARVVEMLIQDGSR